MFYKLVPVLRKEGELMKTIAQLVSNGDGDRDISPTYRRLDQLIKQLWDDYIARVITMTGLLRGALNCMAQKTVRSKV